jgi:C1A family cysteine protease
MQARLQALQDEVQQRGGTYTVGYNPAMDYPLEQLCGYIPPPREFVKRAPRLTLQATAAAPSRLDWREADGVTPIRNQAACGSC